MDDAGDFALSTLRNQGIPGAIGVVQGLSALPKKVQQESKRYAHRFFATEFPSAKVSAAAASLNRRRRASDLTAPLPPQVFEEGNPFQLLRALASARPRDLHWRRVRPYMLARSVEVSPRSDNASLASVRVSGYLRGRHLHANHLVHVTGMGTYRVGRVSALRPPQRRYLFDSAVFTPPCDPLRSD